MTRLIGWLTDLTIEHYYNTTHCYNYHSCQLIKAPTYISIWIGKLMIVIDWYKCPTGWHLANY